MLSFYFQSDTARNSPDDSSQEPAEIVAEQLATSEVCEINIWEYKCSFTRILTTNHRFILLLTWSDDLFYL